ncbi:hypothetical protein [Rubrimonas cliftonensis]|uniref:Uncharacterized protein n=1 Tax=Rubrimonas cliftonensis TaxID=89524 RepID=A0A1H4ATV7_9RHOB|nr:hypothetical protein [Rubrimonas cliftonensis]SEA39238.1 hypothetical protein SAMN05444370_104365 [Rubrimonas cliftonensis]
MKHVDLRPEAPDSASESAPAQPPAAPALAACAVGAALWALNVQHVAAPWPPLRDAAVALLVAYLALTLRQASRTTALIAAACAAVTAMLLATGSPSASIRDGLDFALVFMGFFPALVMVRAAFEAGPQIGRVARRLAARGAAGRSDSLLLLAHVTGAVMTMGAVGVVGPLAQSSGEDASRDAAALTCLRGMCLAVLWTPFTVGMGFAASHLPSVPLWEASLCGAALAAVGLAASLRGGRDLRSVGGAVADVAPVTAPALLAAAALIAANAATGLSTLHLIILLMPPVSLLYVWRMRPGSVAPLGARVWRDLGGMGNDMLLFSCSIAMGFALQAHPGFEGALTGLGLDGLPAVALMAMLTTMALLCALAGLHVTVTGAVTIAIASGLDGALSDLAVFLLILFAWSMGAMLSMSSLAVAVTGRTFDVPMGRLIYGANLPFAAVLGLTLTLAVGLIDWAARS